MKGIQSLIVAVAVALPALSFAQSNQPVTRAEVRAQLIELEQAGYDPSSDQTQYPRNIEAAQARLDAQKGVTAYGASANGSSVSGARSTDSGVIGLGSVYARP
ncbi:membrane protein [Caballeronia peredens]|nr:membrane protein [Caballeronia peredens]